MDPSEQQMNRLQVAEQYTKELLRIEDATT